MAKEEQSVGELPPEETERKDKPEGAGVGALLRASRLRCGEDLRYVSDMLRIRYLYLEAIEDDRFQDLPGPTYTIGFIRAYADHLGLDSDEVVRRLKVETSGANGRAELDFPVPIPESVVPGGAILLVGIVLAIVAYGGWYVSSLNDHAVSELATPVPDRFSKLLTKDKQALPDGGKTGTEKTGATVTPKVDKTTPIKETQKIAKDKTARTVPSDKPAVASSPKAVLPKKQEPPKPDTTGQVAQKQGTTKPAGTRLGGPKQGTPKPDISKQNNAVVDASGARDGAVPTASGGNANNVAATTESKAVTTKNKINDGVGVQANITDGNVSASSSPQAVSSGEAVAAAEPDAASIDAATAPDVAAAGHKQAVASSVVEPKKPEPKPAEPQTAEPNKTEPGTNAVEDASGPSSSQSSANGSSAVPDNAAVVKSTPDVAASIIPTGRTYGLENEGSRITVRAKTDSWIQVRDDIANQLLLTRLLRRGDSYRVPNRPGLKLLTGNAGALDILIDGEVVPSIGKTGVVRRGVALDVDRLRQGTAVIE